MSSIECLIVSFVKISHKMSTKWYMNLNEDFQRTGKYVIQCMKHVFLEP